VLTERDRNLLERGATALRAGDLSAAERFCSEVLQRAPGDSEALNILGAVAFSRRNYADAQRLFLLASSASPENTGAMFNLGKVYEVQKRFEDAAATYLKILSRQPKNRETRLRLGIVRYQQGGIDEAISAFEDLLSEEPDNETAGLSLGVAYNTVGRYEESTRVLRGLLARVSQNVEAQYALADSLYELHRVEEAAGVCRAALASDPNDIGATVLLGQVECDRGEYAAAERLFRAATMRDPERHEAPMNLGVLYQRLGRIDEALENGKRAIEIAPSEPLAHVNYAMGLLLAGDYANGWRQLEWRMLDPKMRDHYPHRNRVPLWTGERLDGTLLIAREQGLGDFILFSRFFAAAAARVTQLGVEVPRELVPLYQNFPAITAYEDRCDLRSLEELQAHLPLCSLPFVLGVGQQIAAPVPYLAANPSRARYYRERLSQAGNALRVGLVWAGSPGHLLDRYRSAPTRAYAQLADLPGIAWFSLQKGAREPMTALEITDLGPDLHDFEETAAAVDALDLVVSVDTAVAHLAGAMGKDVWLLNGFGSYWLWQLRRSDTPWYPTMRLFRQLAPNDWNGLFSALREALKERTRS